MNKGTQLVLAVIVKVVGLLFVAKYVFFAVVGMIGFIITIKSIGFLNTIARNSTGLIDVLLLAGSIYCMITLGVTVGLSIALFSVYYTLVGRHILKDK